MKTTKITLKEDKATSVSSSVWGSNLDSVAFNLTLIANVDVHLAQEIFKLYERARELDNG